jgi:dimethylamine/trimethylamine dehydrogenase
VLVVGAGPAGLECATVLARRNFEYVHLVEASRQVGGHFRWVPRLPGLAEWIRVVDYRVAVAEKLRNLAVVTNKALSLDDILDYGASQVVLATGSHWARDGVSDVKHMPITGADASLDHVCTPEQIMVDGKAVDGERVLVYDCEGYFMGLSLAEHLALKGKRVTVVTPMPTPAPYMWMTEEIGRMIPRLYDLGTEIFAGYVVDEIQLGRVRGHLAQYAAKQATWEADAVVLVTRRVPDAALYRELKRDPKRLQEAGIEAVYRVGDCVAPRPQVAEAIFDGHRLAREIDSDDPDTPLSWIRESRALGMTDGDYDRMATVADVARPSSETSDLVR